MEGYVLFFKKKKKDAMTPEMSKIPATVCCRMDGSSSN